MKLRQRLEEILTEAYDPDMEAIDKEEAIDKILAEVRKVMPPRRAIVKIPFTMKLDRGDQDPLEVGYNKALDDMLEKMQ